MDCRSPRTGLAARHAAFFEGDERRAGRTRSDARLPFGTSALAADGPYVGIGGSLSILNDSNVTAPRP